MKESDYTRAGRAQPWPWQVSAWHNLSEVQQDSLSIFYGLVRDLNRTQLSSLLKCGLGPARLYMFDFNSLSASRPAAGEVHWVIEYALGHLHAKHVMLSRAAPSDAVLYKALRTWHDKLRWRNYFEKLEEFEARYHDKEPVPKWISKLSNKSKNTPHCPHELEEHVEQFINKISDGVIHSCSKQLNIWRNYGTRSRDYSIVQLSIKCWTATSFINY